MVIYYYMYRHAMQTHTHTIPLPRLTFLQPFPQIHEAMEGESRDVWTAPPPTPLLYVLFKLDPPCCLLPSETFSIVTKLL